MNFRAYLWQKKAVDKNTITKSRNEGKRIIQLVIIKDRPQTRIMKRS